MRSALIFASGLVAAQLAGAQTVGPLWSQCGGEGWTGPTICEAGYVCVYINPFYSQCQPPPKPTSSASSTPGVASSVKPTSTYTQPFTVTTTVTVTTTRACPTVLTPCLSSSTSTKPTTTSTKPPATSTKPSTTSTKPNSTTCGHSCGIPTSTSTKPPVTTTIKTSSSTTCTSRRALPTWLYPIISPIDGLKVTKYELAQLSSDRAALAPKGVQSDFEYKTDPILGSSIIIRPIFDPCNPRLWYFTIDEAYPFSYKPLYWTEGPKTTYWSIAPGKELSTAERSPYGAVGTFLACGDEWELYLQTGDDVPPDVYCEKTTLLLTG
ncbi:hypothetical protein FRC03_007269 [Tulasnella sp. 419]|nr:hypothetical protein FRC02_007565 [Tulasnella sp. 418]KAG8959937.1 hypothetical protein FRC03_007269 [Tulasnella sp. 419]